MNISVRFFIGYFLMLGLATWFVLNIFTDEIAPSLRQAREETQIDLAHLLAELAADEIDNASFASGHFAQAVHAAKERHPGATIYDIKKDFVDFRVLVTDAKGIVVFDSARRDIGKDYARWKDIAAVLRGEYGARTSHETFDDTLWTRDGTASELSRGDRADPSVKSTDTMSVMYVSAPVKKDGQLVGVLSVGKPTVTLTPYVDRMTHRIQYRSFAMLAISAFIGVFFSAWLTWSINRLIRYARAVSAGVRAIPPTGGGRQFSELARALATMRERLEGKQYVEKYVQNLTHEMKSPLTAIVSGAELLEDDMQESERRHFAQMIQEQSVRLKLIIDRMLQLARVEQLQRLEDNQTVDLAKLLQQTVQSREGQLARYGLRVITDAKGNFNCQGDAFLLQQALANLLDNAIDFSPRDGEIHIALKTLAKKIEIRVRDHGKGAPDYALEQIFERFYSLPRPLTGSKSTGLGLPFVREVAQLHGGSARFSNHPEGGAEVVLEIAA